MLVGIPEELNNPQKVLDRLGGTIKIAKVFAETTIEGSIADSATKFLEEKFNDHQGKLVFALSAHSFPQQDEIIIKKNLIFIKKNLKALGNSVRFINKNFKNPESAAIKGENLLQKGAEIIAINGHNKIFLCNTVALQDFESYSHRDFDRPARDARLGMLPPKLAQILINLSAQTKLNETPSVEKTLYDPFAGVGTIPCEGLIMGYSILASDIEPEVLKKCEKNFEWNRNTNFIPNQKTRLFVQDATAINKNSVPEKIDYIATESYLGQPMSHFPESDAIKRNFGHITELVTRFFGAIAKVVPAKTPIVITFPFYRDGRRATFMTELPKKIAQLGFTAEELIPNDIRSKFGLGQSITPSLAYDRPDQIVGREVWRFVKN